MLLKIFDSEILSNTLFDPMEARLNLKHRG